MAIESLPTVLIVNDDPTQLQLASRILENDGFAVIAYTSAERALDQLSRQGPVDVIVTDLYMPGIDGWRFCRLLRSPNYSALNNIPILVVSGTFTGTDAEAISTQVGADAFLSAPYEPVALRQLARSLLGNTKPLRLTRVLIVESDQTETNELVNAFAAGGYSVRHAASGEEALQYIRHERPQVLVFNYDLPGVSGNRLLAAVKEPGALTVVIAMTSNPSANLALELIRQGADNYVLKPCEPQYLLHLCETAARQRALLRVEELLELRTHKLKESEKGYRNLFEHAGDGIVTFTLDGIVLGTNRAFEILSGRLRQDLVGKAYGQFLTPASFAQAVERQREAHTQRAASWIYESELARPDGTTFPVEAHCRFLRNRGTEPAMIMAMYRDISAKKDLERQRAEFIAMLAHDIRNPVNLISCCAEILLDDVHEPDAELARNYHLRIQSNAHLLESLVNNYLDVSRIEAGQLILNKSPVYVSELLTRLTQRFQCEARRRNIMLELACRESSVIDGDVVVLERIFANLLHNALKFTPDGGRVTVGAARCHREAVVSVRDTGSGIEPAILPALFQKFHRVKIIERQEGVGLGLYIVKELVTAHGGRVEVDSSPEEGSCFSVFLPLAEREL